MPYNKGFVLCLRRSGGAHVYRCLAQGISPSIRQHLVPLEAPHGPKRNPNPNGGSQVASSRITSAVDMVGFVCIWDCIIFTSVCSYQVSPPPSLR
jgi:hypothetical protein